MLLLLEVAVSVAYFDDMVMMMTTMTMMMMIYSTNKGFNTATFV